MDANGSAFDTMPRRGQLARLRRAAFEALAAYPFEVASLRLVLHAHNTTYRVDTVDGRRFAMRLGVNGRHTGAELAAEVAWLEALARDADVTVPVPQRTRSGALRSSVWFGPLDRELPVVVMSWLAGRDLGRGSPAALRALGRATAALHAHAAAWTMPGGASFPSLEAVFAEIRRNLGGEQPLIGARERSILVEALDRVQPHLDAAFASGVPHALHSDLHGGNAKWRRGRLAVFDFDDARIGRPIHDLTTTAYYLGDGGERTDALLGGYDSVRPLPTFDHDSFQALVASRNLVLVDEIVQSTTAGIRELAPRYVANSAVKLRAYLDTGTYRHAVDGLLPHEG